MSVKQFVGCLVVGASASVFLPSLVLAQSIATVTVNNSVQAVQTPSIAPAAGIAYTQNGSSGSLLTVYTGGFLFCGNPTAPDSSSNGVTVGLQTAHEDQSFLPAAAHPWTFPGATDAAAINYVGTTLNINHNAAGAQWTSLVCDSVGAAGDMPSGLADGIFDSGFDSARETNYNHMVNWTPNLLSQFSWLDPVWSAVPSNACISTQAQPMAIVEDTACAAVTGVRYDAMQPLSNQRAGSMWTNSTESSKFTYAFRVDVRAGAQVSSQSPTQINLPEQIRSPSSTAGGATVSDSVGVNVTVVDAYDSTYLKGTGTYCVISQLPATLNSSVCAGQTMTAPLSNGPLSLSFSTTPPPYSGGISSFYIAVVRDIGAGSHPNTTTPVVGAAILVDSATLTLPSSAGNKFIGDDVVFGFMTNTNGGAGFPWMHEQP